MHVATIVQKVTVAKAGTLLLRDSTTRVKVFVKMPQEILHNDSSLRIWFDRDIGFEVGEDLSADIVSLSRLVTLCSHEKLSDDSRLTSKQIVRLAVVERAMHNIARNTAPATEDDVSKLDKFLNTDD